MNITFNNSTGNFEATVNGSIVATSPNQQYLKQKVRNMGYGTRTPVGGYVASQPAEQAEEPVNEFSVTERFTFIERFTKGVATGSYLSLVLVGGPGLGKTHIVLSTLKEAGLKEILPLEIKPAEKGITGEEIYEQETHTEGDFIVVKGFSTPKAMYRTLWENNGKIIVFDDADGAFKDPNAANILKGALDTSSPRYISWMTERRGADDDLPTRFEFTGRVIFISNLAMKDFPQAILSRAVHVDLAMTTTEKVERIKQVFAQMKPEEGMEDVLALIDENANKFKELSVRTAVMMLNIRKAESDLEMFRKMALYHATV